VFQISKEFQDMYGNPEFTGSIRRKIFGRHGLKLYRVDPNACHYTLALSDRMAYRQELDDRFGPRRHAINPPAVRSQRQFLIRREDMTRRGELG
jgi:hypothetical protein